MAVNRFSVTTFNLYNLNLPGRAMYTDATGWSDAEYVRKIAWTGRVLRNVQADLFGFQELWHPDALAAAFSEARLAADYTLLAPPGHAGGSIVCAGAVRTDLLEGQPRWIVDFPPAFRLTSGGGDDPQAAAIRVSIKGFSRAVLHFTIRPRPEQRPINVYVCHFKSKQPTRVDGERWFRDDRATYAKHADALGAAISTIRRTAEAAAMRFILTEAMKGNDDPVIVLGDLNDGQLSNTLNILTGQPRYLVGLSKGGGDTDLYAAQTLQEYRTSRDVYYTHIFQDMHESLDHILVSRELYDNSAKRVWAFDGLDVCNDHLNDEDHKASGAGDHGIVRAAFKFAPA